MGNRNTISSTMRKVAQIQQLCLPVPQEYFMNYHISYE
jgi:hypothetical protein